MKRLGALLLYSCMDGILVHRKVTPRVFLVFSPNALLENKTFALFSFKKSSHGCRLCHLLSTEYPETDRRVKDLTACSVTNIWQAILQSKSSVLIG